MTGRDEFLAHLRAGVTTVCRCWSVVRADGQSYGFTDHDRAFSFEGIRFKADSGLTARAVQQSTGLSVDNSQALGALCTTLRDAGAPCVLFVDDLQWADADALAALHAIACDHSRSTRCSWHGKAP